MPAEPETQRHACALISRERGGLKEVLLVERASNEFYFPGGPHTADDTDLRNTLARYLKEQMGLWEEHFEIEPTGIVETFGGNGDIRVIELFDVALAPGVNLEPTDAVANIGWHTVSITLGRLTDENERSVMVLAKDYLAG
ncbi:hypothetical protein ACFL26_02060 [Patescibacteria group bacterium]